MRIELRFFASIRDLTGIAADETAMPEGSTVESLLEKMKREHEPLREMERILVAVNGEYVDLSTILDEGDVVAMFPLVSGG
jgi:molybdopterin synthase sulfur carrier subunit